jgi:hypothetical protein
MAAESTESKLQLLEGEVARLNARVQQLEDENARLVDQLSHIRSSRLILSPTEDGHAITLSSAPRRPPSGRHSFSRPQSSPHMRRTKSDAHDSFGSHTGFIADADDSKLENEPGTCSNWSVYQYACGDSSFRLQPT